MFSGCPLWRRRCRAAFIPTRSRRPVPRKYAQDTHTLHIELGAGGIVETKDLDENTQLDVDAEGNICALTVEHAALGLDYPPFPERLALLEETVLALRALFAGRAWQGGRRIPALAGPLLPPGSPPVWVGGTKDAAIGVAARAADGWNAWGLGADAFVARAGELAGLATGAGRDPAEVPPTWAGIMLVGRDANELATLEAERAGKGLGMDIWRGTADDLRRLRDRVEGVGATWLIAVAAGPADRSELLAATLRA